MMNDELKATIDQLANSLQTVTLLSTKLRRELAESSQQAIELEATADKAVRAVKRLQPPDKKDR
jgi:hypothetical protein